MTPLLVLALLAWGTVVALDLVSVPQAMLARPLVAGGVAGALAGDFEAGLRVGAVLELFALDVLPIGASRYPDYGPGTVAAAAGAALQGGLLHETLGLWGVLALVLAGLGAWSLVVLRHANAAAVQRAGAALAAAERGVAARLQLGGLLRDAGRGLLLTALGLVGVRVLAALPPLPVRSGTALTLVLVGCGAGAALHGALRTAGEPRRLARLGLGLAAGVILAVAA